MKGMSKKRLAELFAYLDNLRESGVVNMWGASLYLERAFPLKDGEASKITGMWTKTFDRDKEPEERASAALGT
jgi:hypothetical protein